MADPNVNDSLQLRSRDHALGTSRSSLRTISKKHNINLRDSIINKLNAEQVIESGEFEVLDSARLAEIGIKSRQDRIKVLKLVKKLYNNQELSELRDKIDRAYTRSQLQGSLFLLHQDRLSLLVQMPAREDRVLGTDILNGALVFHGRASARLTDNQMRRAVAIMEISISFIKKSKLREKEEDSLFYRRDPAVQRNVDALIAQILAESKADKERAECNRNV